MILEDDSFYEYEPDEEPWCGSCIKEEQQEVAKDNRVGDEVMDFNAFHQLLDADEEPYQCFKCNKQSEGYELLGEEL